MKKVTIDKNVKSINSSFWYNTDNLDYGTNHNEVMRTQWMVYAAVSTIINKISHLPKYIIKKDDTKKITDHPILDLLRYPNSHMRTRTDLFDKIIASLLLSDKKNGKTGGGQCFIVGSQIVNGKNFNFTDGAIPEQIMPYTSSEMEAIIKDGKFLYWKHTNNNKKYIYKSDETIRISQIDPSNLYKSISNYNSISEIIKSDMKSDEFNKSFFENGCRLSGLLSFQENLDRDTLNEAVRIWEAEYSGPNNNRVAALGNGADYKQFQSTHSDMQFMAQKEYNINAVLAVYHLNKIALGMYEKINYATIKEARKILWHDVYKPLNERILTAFNDQFVRFVGNNDLILKTDYSDVEELRKDYKDLAPSVKTFVDIGLTVAHALEKLGVPLSEEELKKYPWLDERKQEPKEVVVNEDKKDNKNKDDKKDFSKILITDDEKDRRSKKYIDKILQPGEDKLIPKLEKFFISQTSEMIEKVNSSIVEKIYKPIIQIKQLEVDIDKIILDSISEDKKLKSILVPVLTDQVYNEVDQVESEIGELVSWNKSDSYINQYIRQRNNIISGINTTTFELVKDKVNSVVDYAIKNTLTVQETSKLIKETIDTVGEYRKNQSKLIARTEIGSISSKARYEIFKAEGIELVEWLTASDEAVRTTHRKAGDAGAIRLGNSFPFVNMRYPLDSIGKLSDIINCRCSLIAVE